MVYTRATRKATWGQAMQSLDNNQDVERNAFEQTAYQSTKDPETNIAVKRNMVISSI